jgi:hypothetical protein
LSGIKPLHIICSQKAKRIEQRKNIERYKRKCQLTYKDKSMRIRAYFSAKMIKFRRFCNYIFEALKENY